MKEPSHTDEHAASYNISLFLILSQNVEPKSPGTGAILIPFPNLLKTED